MSGIFGGGGKATPQQINIPAFTSSGGITPQQDALGQFGYGEDLLAQGNLFGQSGIGMSTMATQGAEGAKNTEAQTEAGLSDTNQAADYGLYQNQLQGFESGLQNELAINQANTTAADQSLSSLVKASGFGSGVNTDLSSLTG